MAGTVESLAKRFDQFFPKSSEDPRHKESSVTGRPFYHLGEGWTPTKDQIAQARERQAARRANPNTRWRRVVSGSELDTARAVALCATDFVSEDKIVTQRYRTIRSMLFDNGTEFFVRNLRVSPDRFLIEIRHPDFVANSADIPVGFRFIGLTPGVWKSQDYLGMMLDGTYGPIGRLFAPNFERTVQEPDLAEAYIRFVLDHVEFQGTQYYIVADREDFIFKPQIAVPRDQADVFLTSQFRVSELPEENKSAAQADALFHALQIPAEALIPPITLRTAPETSTALAHAIVFLTLIHEGCLYHMCLKISSDGLITSTDQERPQTPKDATLPLVPVRPFAEQRAALKRAMENADAGGPV